MSSPNRHRGGQTVLVVYAVHVAVLSVWASLLDGSWLSHRRDDRGALTTEQAIITAALIGLATILVGAIGIAVNKKIPLIK